MQSDEIARIVAEVLKKLEKEDLGSVLTAAPSPAPVAGDGVLFSSVDAAVQAAKAAQAEWAATPADQRAAVLRRCAQLLEAHAEKLKASALAQADLHLGPSSDRSALHSEIRSWVREQAKTPEGLLQVKQAMADNDDVAAILWHSPSFLGGLAPSVHEGLRLEALQSRKPDLYANLSNSVGLAKLAGKYEAAIRKVAPSFYTPSLAEQASKRVEI